MNDYENYKSNKGIKFRKISNIITIVFSSILMIISLQNFIVGSDNSLGWEFYLLISGSILLLGILANFILPDTFSVCIKETGIEVKSGKKSELIPYSNIKSISPSISFMGSTFNHYEFFKIDFIDKTTFGYSIRFYETSKFRNEKNIIYKHIKMMIHKKESKFK